MDFGEDGSLWQFGPLDQDISVINGQDLRRHKKGIIGMA